MFYIFQPNVRRCLKIDSHFVKRLKKVKLCTFNIKYLIKYNTSLEDTWLFSLVNSIDKKYIVRILEKMLL